MKYVTWMLVGIVVGCFTSFAADETMPQLKFANQAIQAALAARGENVNVTLQVDEAADLKPEGFTIGKEGGAITVTGKDAAGVM